MTEVTARIFRTASVVQGVHAVAIVSTVEPFESS